MEKQPSPSSPKGPRIISPKTPEGKEHVKRAYELYADYLFKACQRRLRAKGYSNNRAFEIASDIVSELWLKTLSHGRVPDMDADERQIKSYLLTALNIAISDYFDKMGREKRIPERLQESISHQDLKSEEDDSNNRKVIYQSLSVPPEVEMNSLAEKERILDLAIKSLPEELGLVIRLRLEKKSKSQIAKIVNKSEIWVKNKLAEAHRKLRILTKEE